MDVLRIVFTFIVIDMIN